MSDKHVKHFLDLSKICEIGNANIWIHLPPLL